MREVTDDVRVPAERDPRTGMTLADEAIARHVLNEALPGLGDHALNSIDSARSILRDMGAPNAK